MLKEHRNISFGRLAGVFIVTMMACIVQKLYFMAATWQNGVMVSDIFDVLLHGVQLDLAVNGYTLVIPLLMVTAAEYIKGTWLKRALNIYYAVMAILLAVIFVVDASLYPYWHFKIDPSVFLYTDKPKDALASVSLWFIISRLLMITIWAMALTYCYSKAIKRIGEVYTPFSIKKLLTSTGRFILLAGITFLMIRGGVGKGTNNTAVAFYSNNQYLNHAAVNPVFNLLYASDIQVDFAKMSQYYDLKEAENIAGSVYPLGKEQGAPTDTLLKTSRPDILLIIWEGGNIYMLKDRKAGPNTMAIAKDGIDFTECYASSFRTDRGQTAVLCGWPAIPKSSLMKYPEKCDNLSSLPRALVNNGYTATFWYGGDISFANTGGFMHQIGFQHNVSEDDFPRKDKATEWGVYDGTLLNRLCDDIVKKHAAGTPAFNCVMTLSSHEPWKVPVQNFYNERLNAFSYTDKCIGDMVARLKKTPLWDNLLVIVTADHGVSFDEDTPLYKEEVTRIPMVWTGGALRKSAIVSKIMNHSDLPATLLSQMGIAHKEFIFSRDVLSPSYTYPSAFHAYNGGISFVDSTGYTTYDIDGERPAMNANPARERKAKGILQWLYRKVAEL